MKTSKWKQLCAGLLVSAMLLPTISNSIVHAEESTSPDRIPPDVTIAADETPLPESIPTEEASASTESTLPEALPSEEYHTSEDATMPEALPAADNEAEEQEEQLYSESRQTMYTIKSDVPEGHFFVRRLNPDGTTDRGILKAAPGDRIKLQYDDHYLEDGQDFVKWVDANGNITDMVNETDYWDCEFTMPAGDVSLHAEITDNCYPVDVENGGIMVEVDSGYLTLGHKYIQPGKEVFLKFDRNETPAGKMFSQWYVKGSNSEDVQLSDPDSQESCYFIMPEHSVEIGVRYTEAFSVSVENGYAHYDKPNGESLYNTNRAPKDAELTLEVNPYTRPEGMAFSKWIVKKGNVKLDTPYLSSECPFIMPGEDVEIAAEFVPGHSFTVTDGSTCKTTPDGFDYYIPIAAPGDYVWAILDPSEIPTGKEFAGWSVGKGNVELSEPQEEVCGFTMPDEDVEIYATYRDIASDHSDQWVRNGDQWWYQHSDGSYTTNDFEEIDGRWYYFNESGYMHTGWKLVNSTWYYFSADGSMVTGWQLISGTWYYFTQSGSMVTGWQSISGTWYYFTQSGSMVTGWQSISGTWYYFTQSGSMVTGWQLISGTWYYFTQSGSMVTGWQLISGTWYYFTQSGSMVTGWQLISGTWYYFTQSGSMVTGWQLISGTWYYFTQSGSMVTGWQWIGGNCYYFFSNGAMAADTWIDGSYVNGSGVWVA